MAIMAIEPVKGLVIEEMTRSYTLSSEDGRIIGWFNHRYEVEYANALLEQGIMRVREVSIQKDGRVLATVDDFNSDGYCFFITMADGVVNNVMYIEKGVING